MSTDPFRADPFKGANPSADPAPPPTTEATEPATEAFEPATETTELDKEMATPGEPENPAAPASGSLVGRLFTWGMVLLLVSIVLFLTSPWVVLQLALSVPTTLVFAWQAKKNWRKKKRRSSVTWLVSAGIVVLVLVLAIAAKTVVAGYNSRSTAEPSAPVVQFNPDVSCPGSASGNAEECALFWTHYGDNALNVLQVARQSCAALADLPEKTGSYSQCSAEIFRDTTGAWATTVTIVQTSIEMINALNQPVPEKFTAFLQQEPTLE